MKLSGLTSTLLLSLALAGCLGSDDTSADVTAIDEADSVGESTPEPSTTAPSGEDGAPGAPPGETRANTPPEASLAADVLEGEAPLTVNFTLNGTDADGDDLTWGLDLDGDLEADLEGTTLPETVNHTFEAAGNHTVVLTVDDGQNRTSTNVTIHVVAAAPEELGEATEPHLEDRGWYEYDPATGLCYVKEYEDVGGAGVLYRSPLSGGDWFIVEANGVPGLQIEDNHPVGDPIGSGLDLPDCVDGDQVLL